MKKGLVCFICVLLLTSCMGVSRDMGATSEEAPELDSGLSDASQEEVAEEAQEDAPESQPEVPEEKREIRYYSNYEGFYSGSKFNDFIMGNPIFNCEYINDNLGTGSGALMSQGLILCINAWTDEIDNAYELIYAELPPEQQADFQRAQDGFVEYVLGYYPVELYMYQTTVAAGGHWNTFGALTSLETLYQDRAIYLIDVYMQLTGEEYEFVFTCPAPDGEAAD